MSKLFLRVSCAVSVLLVFSQLAVAQGSTTDVKTNALITQTNSSEPKGSSESESQGAQETGPGQARSDEDLNAASGVGTAHRVEAHRDASVYPGQGTTINGIPVYVSALIKVGDRVQTGSESGKITIGAAILDIGLNSIVLIQEPLVVSCGVVSVRSGTIAINDGKNTLSLTTGQTAYATSTSCESELPDSPGSLQSKENHRPTKLRSGSQAAASGALFDTRVVDRSFLAVNTALLASSFVAVETTHRCLEAGACTFLPETFHRRRNMYLAGMPVAAGVSYFGYYLKEKGYRWWFVPAALATAGNIVVITHAARYSH